MLELLPTNRLQIHIRKNSIQSAHWPEKSHSKNDNVIETRELTNNIQRENQRNLNELERVICDTKTENVSDFFDIKNVNIEPNIKLRHVVILLLIQLLYTFWFDKLTHSLSIRFNCHL